MLVEKDVGNFQMIRWLADIMAGHKGFICGGCFKNLFCKEKVKDIDVFFGSRADFETAVSHFDDSDGDFYQWYENESVTAFKREKDGIVVELNHKIFGTPEDILNQFDFTIAKCAYFKKEVPDDGEEPDSEKTHIEYTLLMHEDFFEHLHMKRLVIDDTIPFPMSTLERMFRYAKYGYFPCRETKIKIAKAINELQPEQITVSNVLYNGMD